MIEKHFLSIKIYTRVFSIIHFNVSSLRHSVVREVCQDSYKQSIDKILGHLTLSGKVTDEHVRSLLFGDYMNPDQGPKVYDEVTDLKELTSTIEHYLAEYNQLSKAPMSLVMFKFAIEHVSRVSRVLLQDNGHALLAGK